MQIASSDVMPKWSGPVEKNNGTRKLEILGKKWQGCKVISQTELSPSHLRENEPMNTVVRPNYQVTLCPQVNKQSKARLNQNLG